MHTRDHSVHVYLRAIDAMRDDAHDRFEKSIVREFLIRN